MDLIDSPEVLQINKMDLSSLGLLILDEWSDTIRDLALSILNDNVEANFCFVASIVQFLLPVYPI